MSKPISLPAVHVLETAASLVGGDRDRTHGNKTQNFNKIAAIWNGTLAAAGIETSRQLDAHDVCNLMEAMKIARRYSGARNRDDYVDGAGYAGCAFEVLGEG